jgi:hypothetical protein
MGRPTPETGGGTPPNQGLTEFKPLSQERRVGWGIKKPEGQSLREAKPPDGDILYRRVYASGMSNCVGLILTPEDMRKDEEDNL